LNYEVKMNKALDLNNLEVIKLALKEARENPPKRVVDKSVNKSAHDIHNRVLAQVLKDGNWIKLPAGVANV